jgi:hypothetical protein
VRFAGRRHFNPVKQAAVLVALRVAHSRAAKKAHSVISSGAGVIE